MLTNQSHQSSDFHVRFFRHSRHFGATLLVQATYLSGLLPVGVGGTAQGFLGPALGGPGVGDFL